MRACQSAVRAAILSSHPATAATHLQPLKMAKNPIGTAASSSGTMIRFAVRGKM